MPKPESNEKNKKGGGQAPPTITAQNNNKIHEKMREITNAWEKATLKVIQQAVSEARQNVYWTYKPKPLERMRKVKKMKTFMIPKLVKVVKQVVKLNEDGCHARALDRA